MQKGHQCARTKTTTTFLPLAADLSFSRNCDRETICSFASGNLKSGAGRPIGMAGNLTAALEGAASEVACPREDDTRSNAVTHASPIVRLMFISRLGGQSWRRRVFRPRFASQDSSGILRCDQTRCCFPPEGGTTSGLVRMEKCRLMCLPSYGMVQSVSTKTGATWKCRCFPPERRRRRGTTRTLDCGRDSGVHRELVPVCNATV